MAFDDSCFCRKSAHSVAILAQVASSPQAARPALCLLSVLAAQLWLTMVFGKLTAAGAAAAGVLHHKHEKEEGKEGKGGNATAGNSSGATGHAPVMGAGYAGGMQGTSSSYMQPQTTTLPGPPTAMVPATSVGPTSSFIGTTAMAPAMATSHQPSTLVGSTAWQPATSVVVQKTSMVQPAYVTAAVPVQVAPVVTSVPVVTQFAR